jgi:hypothetical protein
MDGFATCSVFVPSPVAARWTPPPTLAAPSRERRDKGQSTLFKNYHSFRSSFKKELHSIRSLTKQGPQLLLVSQLRNFMELVHQSNPVMQSMNQLLLGVPLLSTAACLISIHLNADCLHVSTEFCFLKTALHPQGNGQILSHGTCADSPNMHMQLDETLFLRPKSQKNMAKSDQCGPSDVSSEFQTPG